MKLYKSYLFKNKDPAIDVVRTVVQDTGSTYKKLSNDSGVAAGTIRNWFSGPTKRPQFATLEAVARAAGHTFKCVKLNGSKRR